ncbi:hypothetical protein [Xanthobacter sp. 126]|uniref:cysteine dioxygenase family protein n=1 Tax=Xanthobacter sp. 126 TaxID=1131814 RepID=UPI00045EBF99|nr:hypothetical protein [Xanthobacter sp. 126]
MTAAPPEPLRRFCWDIQSMVELADDPREILMIGRDLMGRLVAQDDWLPEVFARLDGAPFRQYQLYADQMTRFTVIATVLAPGAALPVSQQTVWKLAGVLRGEVVRQRLALPDGVPPVARSASRRLGAGAVDAFSPKDGDGLAIANGSSTAPVILIEVHGAEIGDQPRHTVAPDGTVGSFTTVYANPPEAPAWDILTIQARIVD